LSEKSHKKYHEPLVVFLDDCFCNDDVATALVDAGFTVEQFTVHFPRSDAQPNMREQGVKDPRVIALSHRKGWLILTTDHSMRTDHAEEFLKNPNATVLATSTNCDGEEVWIRAIIQAKIGIERLFKKKERPWYARINQQGQITICKTIEARSPRKAKSKRK
jgi:hypothetical protein